MTIEAKVICDSVSPEGIRLTTLQLRYPKFIHGELMTHRMLSRNASSSRAIPVKRLIEDIRRDPAMPVFWGSNKPGMQAGEELHGLDLDIVKLNWERALEHSIRHAELMYTRGLHKQIANRILEPWCHINVVVTATEWTNFFALRRHPDAQPEMKALADCMWEARKNSEPMPLDLGEWHVPYIQREELGPLGPVQTYLRGGKDSMNVWNSEMFWELVVKLSVARCARVSYLTHEGKQSTIEEDLALYDRLVGAHPMHASPAEHQATPDVWRQNVVHDYWFWENAKEHGNFRGWRQYRKTLERENITEYDG